MVEINVESTAVQGHLNILQGVINRMATNSAACKTWCIGLVSAIIVILAQQEKPEYIDISFIPILLFLFLDTYYLSLEKRFRDSYNKFVEKLHKGTLATKDLFVVTPGQGIKVSMAAWIAALCSLSVWPFYLCVTAMAFFARHELLTVC